MNVPREQIAVAVFNLIKGITFGSNMPGGGFATSGRAGRMWSDLADAAQPAMFLFQVGETATQQRTAIGLYKWEMDFWCLIYLRADPAQVDAGTTVETAMNAILDALEKALQPITGEKQTLGWIVNNVWIEGQIIVDTGITDQQCALIIPLKVQTGS